MQNKQNMQNMQNMQIIQNISKKQKNFKTRLHIWGFEPATIDLQGQRIAH
jgi:hypothetical protein